MPKSIWSELLKGLSLLSQLGLSILASILIGILGGRFLDNLLGTAITFTIIGTILGVIGGGFSCYRLIKVAIKEDNHGNNSK